MKCLQYWPDEGVKHFGEIIVKMRYQEIFSEFVLRTFEINQVRFQRNNCSISEPYLFFSNYSAPIYSSFVLYLLLVDKG